MGDNRDENNSLDERSRTPTELQQLSASPSPEPSSSKPDNNRQTNPSMPININRIAQQNSTTSIRNDSPQILTDADEKPLPIDKILKTANTMSTMMMAHKIALEDDFKLEPGMDINGPLMSLSPIIGSSPKSKGPQVGTEPSLQNKVKDIMHEAYWDLFKEELESHSKEYKDERKFDISKQLLCDVKQRIFELLLPQHSKLKQDLEDKLDPQILDQLSQVNSLNLIDYAKYILEVLSKLCAPVRDEKLKELTETSDIVQLYRGIMDLLDSMRLDFANFTLNRFKPHIKAHSQEYEREKFNEILKQQQSIGIDGLEYTKLWLKRAVDKIDSQYGIEEVVNEKSSLDDMQLSDIVDSTSSGNKPSTSCQLESKRDLIIRSDITNKVINAGYCELLDWSPDKQKLYPETLLFDKATFESLRDQFRVLVLTSSILLTTFAFVNRFKLHDNNDFRILVKSHVITLMTANYNDQIDKSSPSNKLDQVKLETIATCLVKDIREKLEEVNKDLLGTFELNKQLFVSQILDIESSSNRVKNLAERRIMEFLETLLSIDVKHQQNKISSKNAPPVNIPLGLNVLADELTLTMAQLVKIIRYNRKVFYEHYIKIIEEIVLKMLK